MSTLVYSRLDQVLPDEIVRGVNHSKIVTGPPVRIKWTRRVSPKTIRVCYTIIGLWTTGWRDLPFDRSVTIERNI